MRVHGWLSGMLGLGLAACSAAVPDLGRPAVTAAAQTAVWRQVVGTATALRLTASAPTALAATAPPTRTPLELPPTEESAGPYAPVTITVSAQQIGAGDYIVSAPVIVSVEAPGAASVVFFVTPAGTGQTPRPQFVDEEASDGWVWTWTPPAAGWLGHLWAEAHYPDGYWQPTATLLTISPDGLGTPAAAPTPGAFVTLTPAPPTATAPAAPADLTASLQVRTDCANASPRLAGWGRNSPRVVSPDGQWLAQSVNPVDPGGPDGPAGLRVTKADGSGETWIPAPNWAEPVADPLWSPDSQWLILNQVTLSQPGGGEVWKVRPDGSGLTWLARYLGYHDALAWSPDGRYAAFTEGQMIGQGSGTQVINYQVFLAPADGSGRRLRVGLGCDPDWGTGPILAAATPAAGLPRILSFRAEAAAAESGGAVTLEWAAEGEHFSICPRLQTFVIAAGCLNELPPTGTRTVLQRDLLGNYTDFQLVAQSAAGVVTSEAPVAVRCPGYDTWFLANPPQMCPEAPPLTSAAAFQAFERGRMIWLAGLDQFYILLDGQPGRLSPVSGPLVLKPGASPDNRVPETPPAGLLEPVSGFGLVWRNEARGGEGVREQLGWAVGAEAGYQATQQCEHRTGPTWNCYLLDPAGRVIHLAYLPYFGYLWTQE